MALNLTPDGTNPFDPGNLPPLKGGIPFVTSDLDTTRTSGVSTQSQQLNGIGYVVNKTNRALFVPKVAPDAVLVPEVLFKIS